MTRCASTATPRTGARDSSPPPTRARCSSREGAPILNLETPESIGERQQRGKLDLLAALNRHHKEKFPHENELDARLQSYELAFRMQAHAPEQSTWPKRAEATKELYGMGQEHTAIYGRNLLLARRLVERGVRFVQAYCRGLGCAPEDRREPHQVVRRLGQADRRTAHRPEVARDAGRDLGDLGRRVGRTPFNEEGDGRDHNPWGFTIWMAGGGIKGGQTVGTTDELGLRAEESPYHVHDIHATILHLLGLDHLSLTYLHNGRSVRATVNGGKLIHQALA